jgi:hypothetical protein
VEGERPGGADGLIAAWSDKANAGDTYDIMAERVNARGLVQWNVEPGGGTYVYNGPGEQTDVQVAQGTSGSAIVAWQDDRNNDSHVYSQRMDSAGSRRWAAVGVQLGTGGWTVHEEHGITADGSGGAIVAWEGNTGTGPDQNWCFAEGTTRSGFNEYICLQNPGNVPTTAYLTYMLDDGTNTLQTVDLPADSRETVEVFSFINGEHDLSVRVESIDETEIIVERPMYFLYGSVWPGGHDVLGY